MDLVLTNEELITVAVVFVALIFVYLIIREFRLMRTDARKMEIELDREKLKLLQQDVLSKGYPFTRMTSEQLDHLKEIDEQNFVLETDIFAREKAVESRLKRLENYVKLEKLDRLLERIKKEEKKIR
ncbi:MAG: hypothetical protein HXS41_04520 [Theionarchaea archaeon]|nr:hypothetical protein [Theionarchaea archaeon]MBU6999535.1 hypothetical protein [Theionarchaea archaeon]MBU7020301.1 hypothetical protein [Theionarchaea archaeon]